MKAIALWQPWASLMAWGFKTWETRHWPTRERGEVLVYATKTLKGKDAFYHPMIKKALGEVGYTNFNDLPFGCLLSVHNLEDCQPSELAKVGILRVQPDPQKYPSLEATTQALLDAQLEIVCGDYSAGRFAFRMPLLKRFDEPIPYTYPIRGPSKFFRVPLTPQIYKQWNQFDHIKNQLETGGQNG